MTAIARFVDFNGHFFEVCYGAQAVAANASHEISHMRRRYSALPSDRPHSYSRYWTGTSLQPRLMRGNIIKERLKSFVFEETPSISLVASYFKHNSENANMVNFVNQFCALCFLLQNLQPAEPFCFFSSASSLSL